MDGSVGRDDQRRGRRPTLVAAVLIAITLGLALVARAEISSIQPAAGAGEPGQTFSALVTVHTRGLASCVTATSSTLLVVTFDGLTTKCGSGTWFADMEVAIPPSTPPGAHTVEINELTVGGSLLAVHPWPLTVTAPATTTSPLLDPILSSTTLPPDPSTLLTTVSTTPTTTSTTRFAGAPTTIATPPASPSSAIGARSEGQPGSDRTAGNFLAAPSPISAAGHGDGGEPTTVLSARGEFSEVAVTSGLMDIADRSLPPVFAQAVLSPLVILEVLMRAVGRTTGGLLLPLGVTVLAGLGLAWRLRRDAEQLPELDDRTEIPEDGTDAS